MSLLFRQIEHHWYELYNHCFSPNFYSFSVIIFIQSNYPNGDGNYIGVVNCDVFMVCELGFYPNWGFTDHKDQPTVMNWGFKFFSIVK